MATVGSLEALRELNRLRVVDALRRRGSASRSDLARHTGLSRTTVATLVTDLQARGLVVDIPADSTQPEQTGRGRPPTLLRLDLSVGAALGLDFGHTHMRVALGDLASTVLAERRLELEIDHASTAAFDAAVALIDDVLNEAGVPRDDVIGVGMGLSGPIELSGRVGRTVILPDWVGKNAARELSMRLGLHVEADNDANLGALAEVTSGAARGLTDVVYVMVSSCVPASPFESSGGR